MSKPSFPTREVAQAASLEECIRWNRFLPSPKNADEIDALMAITDRIKELRDELPHEEYVAASKRVGWEGKTFG